MHLRRSPCEIFARTPQSSRFAQGLVPAVVVLMIMLIGFPGIASAGDGAIDINQAKVMAAGGFPFNISSRGRYRLTSSLLNNASANAIEVGASFVDIDLNGFTVRSLMGGGIHTSVNGANFTTVHDGTVFSEQGALILLDSAAVRNVAGLSAAIGIQVGNDSSVTDSITQNCGSRGIAAGVGAQVSGNRVVGNQGGGISVGNNSRISGNTVNGNVGDGIDTGDGAQVSGNIVVGNTSIGILVFRSGSLITDNVIGPNTNFGLSCTFGGTGSGYARNTFTNGGGGNVSNPPCVNLGENLCDGKLCP